MTSVSKNVYIDKLADIVNKYNNTFHSRIKMKPFEVKCDPYIDFCKGNFNKNPRFQVGDHKIISKYKRIFAKCYFPN